MEDVEAALDEIGKRPRKEFETAFPDLGSILALIRSRVYSRKQVEEMEALKREREEQDRYRQDHPEEFVDWKSLPGYIQLQERIDAAKGKRTTTAGHTQEEIEASIRASKNY